MAAVRCISCGYDLSGQTSGYCAGVRCPECGEGDAAREPPPVPGVWGPAVLCVAGMWCWVIAVLWQLFAGRMSRLEVVGDWALLAVAMVCFVVARRGSARGTRVAVGVIVSTVGIVVTLLIGAAMLMLHGRSAI